MLHTVDKTTAVATLVGSIGFNGVSGLAALNDGRLVGSAVSGGNPVLIEIDRTTGAGTLIGVIGTAGVTGDCARVGDLAYDAATSTLYGMADRCNGSFALDTLLIIDTTTGDGTPVAFGVLGAGFYLGTAFDSSSGKIYTCDGSQGLSSIDPATSVETLIGGAGSANAMDIDTSSGTAVAYGTLRTGNLITIDLATGNETPVGNTGLTGLDAILFDVPLGPVASCTFRNGLGGNPAIFTCVSKPVVGQPWLADVSLALDTLATFVGVGIGGPTSGILVFGGSELLILPPYPIVVSALGAHSTPIPPSPTLLGVTVATQGGQINTSGIVLANAQDLVLGF
jgi:hypothetical protein